MPQLDLKSLSLAQKLLWSPADSVATADAQDWDKTKLQKFGGKLKNIFTK